MLITGQHAPGKQYVLKLDNVTVQLPLYTTAIASYNNTYVILIVSTYHFRIWNYNCIVS